MEDTLIFWPTAMAAKDDGYRQPAPGFMVSLVPQEPLKGKA
jgi:hypothetical protein